MVDRKDTLMRVLWGILAYIFWLFGLVMAIIWWRDERLNAKTCLVGLVLKIVTDIAAIAVILVAIFNYGSGISNYSTSIITIIFIVGLALTVLYAVKIEDLEDRD